MSPIIVGISGGSCSGKTTFSRTIAQMVGADKCALLRQDDYYIDLSILSPDGDLPNFDAPEALEFSLLATHLKALKAGQPIKVPTYDFASHSRTDQFTAINPRPLIIVEGMLVLNQAEIREQLDYSIFISSSKKLRLSRRIERDIAKRGRTRESVLTQFNETVEPSHKRWVEPSKKFATRILSQKEYLRGRNKLARELIQQWTAWEI